MAFDWASLSPADLRDEASMFRHDNDDGSDCYFDAEAADWQLQVIDPNTVDAFSDVEGAKDWLRDELSSLRASGLENRAAGYEQMIQDGIEDPVIIGASERRLALWDGWHRTAIAMVRGEQLLAIVGTKVAASPAPKTGAEEVPFLSTASGDTARPA
ncbi:MULTISPECIES: hypothetical protein [unclassified Pseudomonas]|jgi:hypothetical protein|uniref:hypothetical protein n=1 Tax=unclassified Pseudomonas TaxID=196821 RepID=UPI0008388BE3|nr:MULTISPECIES: hypothetical protein [unclassified Pseudomonas]QIH07389.1 hypothetical protein ATY02_11970 [Pseudomonas sp. BIOMIG1BAC]